MRNLRATEFEKKEKGQQVILMSVSSLFERRDVEFFTKENVLLRGWLFQPIEDEKKRYPAIVMTHGYGAVKELYLDLYATVFVKSKFVVLVYDHENFGESEGEPKQEIDPKKQIQNYCSAIDYLQTLNDLVDGDRIGIWGTSYSGGHVLVVSAIDKRVKCVVSQMPSINGTKNLKRRSKTDEEYQKLLNAFQKDKKQKEEGKLPRRIPIIRPEEQGDWWNFFDVDHAPDEDKWRYRNWKNEQTLRSVEMYGEHNPEDFVEQISPCPLLMLVADNDTVTFTQDEILLFETKAQEPKKLIIFEGDHFSAYRQQLQLTSNEAIQWFRKYLQS